MNLIPKSLLVVIALLPGCVVSPIVGCVEKGDEWQLMAQPPANASELILLAEEGNKVLEESDSRSTAWFTSRSGDLFVCSYRTRPVPTSNCGSLGYIFREKAGEVTVHVSIVSC